MVVQDSYAKSSEFRKLIGLSFIFFPHAVFLTKPSISLTLPLPFFSFLILLIINSSADLPAPKLALNGAGGESATEMARILA